MLLVLGRPDLREKEEVQAERQWGEHQLHGMNAGKEDTQRETAHAHEAGVTGRCVARGVRPNAEELRAPQ